MMAALQLSIVSMVEAQFQDLEQSQAAHRLRASWTYRCRSARSLQQPATGGRARDLVLWNFVAPEERAGVLPAVGKQHTQKSCV